MKRVYTHEELPNPLAALRRAGYSPFKDPQTGDESFIIRLTSEFYPRFHLYAEQAKGGLSLNIHLDQKKPSYGAGHAHGGEYDGDILEREMGRIDSWIKAEKKSRVAPSEHEQKKKPQTKRPWWQKMFFG
jgi:hypothetical protein